MALHCTAWLPLAGSPFGVGPSVIFDGFCCFATLFFIIVVALCDALEKKLSFPSCLCCCRCFPAPAIHAQPDLVEAEMLLLCPQLPRHPHACCFLFAPPWRCRYRPLLPALLSVAVSVPCWCSRKPTSFAPEYRLSSTCEMVRSIVS